MDTKRNLTIRSNSTARHNWGLAQLCISFYTADVGKKTITTMPALMAQVSTIGVGRAKENISDLRAMVKAESAHIQNPQSQ